MSYFLTKPAPEIRYTPEFLGEIDCDGRPIPREINVFSIFANTHREQLRQRMPQLSDSEQTAKLRELWSQMTPDHQELYYEEARIEMGQLMRSHPSDYSYRPDLLNTYGDRLGIDKRHVMQFKTVHVPETNPSYKFGGYVPPFNVFSSRKKRRKMEMASSRTCFQIPVLKDSPQSRPQSLKPGNIRTNSQGQPKPRPKYTVQSQVQGQFLSNQQQLRQSKDYINWAKRDIGGMQTAADDECQRAVDSITMDTFKDDNEVTEEEEHLLQQNRRLVNTKTHQVDNTVWKPHPGGDTVAKVTNEQQRRQTTEVAEENIVVKQPYDNQSGGDIGNDEEMAYVMIPCDVSIAKMLGWPVHRLPRVTKTLLDSFKEELLTDSHTELLPGSESLPKVITEMSPECNIDYSLLSHVHPEENCSIPYQPRSSDSIQNLNKVNDKPNYSNNYEHEHVNTSTLARNAYSSFSALDLSTKNVKFLVRDNL